MEKIKGFIFGGYGIAVLLGVVSGYFALQGNNQIIVILFSISFILAVYLKFKAISHEKLSVKILTIPWVLIVVAITFLFAQKLSSEGLKQGLNLKQRPPVCSDSQTIDLLKEVLKKPEIQETYSLSFKYGYSVDNKSIKTTQYDVENNEYQCEATITPNLSTPKNNAVQSQLEKQAQEITMGVAQQALAKVVSYTVSISEDGEEFYVNIGN